MDIDVLTTNTSSRTRSLLSLGGPLPCNATEMASTRAVAGYSATKTDEEVCKDVEKAKFLAFTKPLNKKLLAFFDMKGIPLMQSMDIYFRSPYRDTASKGGITAQWNGLNYNDMDSVVSSDFLMAVLSIVFVCIWVCVHVWSCFVGLMGMLQIVLSLGTAYFIYTYVLGIPVFMQMNVLAVYLVLGVGADDLFVLNDSWRQSRVDVKRRPGETDDDYMARRVDYAYARTTAAVFNTSFTTALAFVCTGISPLMPISAFGWFAACAIVVNYLFVITFTPAVLVISERYWFRCCRSLFPCCKKSCCCTMSNMEGQVDTLRLKPGEKAPPTKAKKLSCINRFFSVKFPDAMLATCGKSKVKPLPIMMLIALLGWTGFAAYHMSQLTPPTKEEQFMPADHMSTGFMDRMANEYLSGEEDKYWKGEFYVGLKSYCHDPEFNKFKPDDAKGTTILDPAFVLTTEVQVSLFQFCEQLESQQCSSGGTSSSLQICADFGASPKRMVLEGTTRCFIRDFYQWNFEKYNGGAAAYVTALGGEAMSATGAVAKAAQRLDAATFEERLVAFTKDGKSKAKSKLDVGIVGKRVAYARIWARLAVIGRHGISAKQPLYNIMQNMTTTFNLNAPAPAKTMVQKTNWYWMWMQSESAFVNGLLSGLTICFPVALLVLLVATRNVVVSIAATVSIGCIVVSVLGLCHMLGWELGISESIAGIVVIGFSVDYVVHMGHMYVEAGEMTGEITREGRFRYASEKMGATVLAGAITTAGSGAIMFLCQMGFFAKMAILICFTIFCSFVFSFCFFMAFLAIMGPEDEFGDLGFLCGKKKKEGGDGGGKVAGDKVVPQADKLGDKSVATSSTAVAVKCAKGGITEEHITVEMAEMAGEAGVGGEERKENPEAGALDLVAMHNDDSSSFEDWST